MLELKVEGMSCGSCVNSITKAVQSEDPKALVQVDLKTQMVRVNTILSSDDVKECVQEAGFPVLSVKEV